MKKHAPLFAVAALVVGLCAPASAQPSAPPPYPTPVIVPPIAAPAENGTEQTTPPTARAYGSPHSDPAVIAARAALNTELDRYDGLVLGILHHTQRIDFQSAPKHADWFSENSLNEENVDSYITFLEQRLKLDADQEREIRKIEDTFLADVTPLYTAYSSALQTACDERRLRITIVPAVTAPVATPSVEEAPRRVEVRGAQPPDQKRVIRNRDRK